MIVKMLASVTPNEYGMKGQHGWADAVQYHAGHEYDLDPEIADAMIYNGDAEPSTIMEDLSEALFDCFKSKHPIDQLAALSKLPNQHMKDFRASTAIREDEDDLL